MGCIARCPPLDRNARLLLVTRMVRMFSYGAISVTLFLYLTAMGLDEVSIGVLFTMTLVGDLVISLVLTTRADRFGRKRTLQIGAMLQLFSGIAFATVNNYLFLVVSGTIGVITITGNEIGPFLAVEQACLAEIVTDKEVMTTVFGVFSFAGYLAAAAGALAGGGMVSALQRFGGFSDVASSRGPVLLFAVLALVKAICYTLLSPAVEVAANGTGNVATPTPAGRCGGLNWASMFGLHRASSRIVVTKLSALFWLDAFGGGFVTQTYVAFWFHLRYGVDPATMGALLLGCNVLAGASSLATTVVVRRLGAIKTMVFTHLPSNILLLFVPLVPGVEPALAVLLARFCISQMDVPARETYVALVVAADERSAAGGITRIVRSVGLSLSPLAVGALLRSPSVLLSSAPFLIAGGLKIVSDLLLYCSFVLSSGRPAGASQKPPGQEATGSSGHTAGETDDVELLAAAP